MLVFRGLNKKSTQPLALTIGNFDGLHLGHRTLLYALREIAAEHQLRTAVIIFEPHPREFFTPQSAPARLTSLREKLKLFSKIGIDCVYVCHFNSQFAQMSATAFMDILCHTLCAKHILIGDDFRFGQGRAGDFNLMQQLGALQNVCVEAIEGVHYHHTRISSTAIRAALSLGQLEAVRRYLGRHYSLTGRVVRGDGLGRQLGFPTANIQLKYHKLPLLGVFIIQAYLETGDVLQGVASVGVRPTVKIEAKPILEVHLFDFSKEIYGKTLRIEFLKKIRDEEKYPNLDALVQQISRDVNQAKQWFESIK